MKLYKLFSNTYKIQSLLDGDYRFDKSEKPDDYIIEEDNIYELHDNKTFKYLGELTDTLVFLQLDMSDGENLKDQIKKYDNIELIKEVPISREDDLLSGYFRQPETESGGEATLEISPALMYPGSIIIESLHKIYMLKITPGEFKITLSKGFMYMTSEINYVYGHFDRIEKESSLSSTPTMVYRCKLDYEVFVTFIYTSDDTVDIRFIDREFNNSKYAVVSGKTLEILKTIRQEKMLISTHGQFLQLADSINNRIDKNDISIVSHDLLGHSINIYIDDTSKRIDGQYEILHYHEDIMRLQVKRHVDKLHKVIYFKKVELL